MVGTSAEESTAPGGPENPRSPGRSGGGRVRDRSRRKGIAQSLLSDLHGRPERSGTAPDRRKVPTRDSGPEVRQSHIPLPGGSAPHPRLPGLASHAVPRSPGSALFGVDGVRGADARDRSRDQSRLIAPSRKTRNYASA